MNWRWSLYWLKDKLKGGNVKKAYEDIKANYFNLDKNSQSEKLNKLLKYARENSDFYHNCSDSINSFPVINKQIIKDNFDQIFVKKYDINNLHKMSTSGSTGTPFTVYQNGEKRNRVLAEVIFYGEITGYYFGNKQIFFRSWTDKNKKSFLKRFLQNMITYDITCLNDDVIKEALDIINSKNIVSILSYASTLDRLCEYALRNNYEYKKKSLKNFLSSAEVLNEETRRKISNIFHSKCYSRYSNQENGILGQDDGVDKTFLLNEADYYFEFLKLDSDEPASEGELSRIVITDLYNYAMPMIRYDTGDLAIYEKKDNRLLIKEIYGRKQDMIYDTKGQAVSPHGISVNLWSLSSVKQWQFVQKGEKDYQLNINNTDSINEEEVKSLLKEILGEDAIITIEYYDEIPVLSSGKYKYIVNDMSHKV